MTHALTKPRSTAIQAVGGGRSWWAHRQYTRINTELTILPEKVEETLPWVRIPLSANQTVIAENRC